MLSAWEAVNFFEFVFPSKRLGDPAAGAITRCYTLTVPTRVRARGDQGAPHFRTNSDRETAFICANLQRANFERMSLTR